MSRASVVFTVHNRRELLLESVRLAKLQTVPVEIIVMDDCSTDGVGEVLAQEHPDVIYERSDVSKGPCYQRNRGVQLASCEIVVILDDDSWLVSADTVAQTLDDFADHATGIVAVPFRSVLADNTLVQSRSADDDRQVIDSFIACAFAVRRSIFLRHGQFDETFFYMVEEIDSSIRMLAAGYPVEVGTADAVHHQSPAGRKSSRIEFLLRRNRLLLWHRYEPRNTWHLLFTATMIKNLVIGKREDHLRLAAKANIQAMAMLWRGRVRSPLSPQMFKLLRALIAGSSMKLTDVRRMLLETPEAKDFASQVR